MEGIDLSKKMLELAKQKDVYDKLSNSDIVEYLSRMPLNFDCYIAADVFVYTGNLTEVFRLIKSRSKKPGMLVFLQSTLYLMAIIFLTPVDSHIPKSYIESLCKKFGYKISHFSTTQLERKGLLSVRWHICVKLYTKIIIA